MWLIIHEKNEPIRLGITRKPSCERSPNLEGVLYHTILYKKSLTIRITLAAGAVVLQAFLVEKRRQEAVQDFG